MNARLKREVAEIALTEYRMGTAMTEEATAEGAVRLARSEVENARRKTAEAKDRLTSGVVAAVLLVLGACQGMTRPARGADDPPAAARSAFVAEVRRTLKADDLRLVALANRVLGDPAAIADQVDRARIDAMKAEGEAQYATMRREVAELALKEFTKATLPQQEAATEGELRVANASLVRARALVQQANGDVEKATSQLELYKANLEIQSAESKKKFLAEYTKTQRTKDLEAQLARARTEERSRKSEMELSRRRLERLEKTATSGPNRTEVEKRILALIERALPIEDRIQAGLDRLVKEAHLAESDEKGIRDLTEELGAIIDEAEAIKAADDFNRVKERLKKAARP